MLFFSIKSIFSLHGSTQTFSSLASAKSHGSLFITSGVFHSRLWLEGHSPLDTKVLLMLWLIFLIVAKLLPLRLYHHHLLCFHSHYHHCYSRFQLGYLESFQCSLKTSSISSCCLSLIHLWSSSIVSLHRSAHQDSQLFSCMKDQANDKPLCSALFLNTPRF